MTNLPAIPVQGTAGEVSPYNDPKQEVERAGKMAKVLQDVVRQAGLSRKFGGQKEHLFFEAWQTIGRFFNCTPATEWSRPIMEYDKIVGWEAKAIVTNSAGLVVAAAESMCSMDEPNWKGKHQYAIRSMAQTRAASKALRQAFAWVAVLAGYAATPAEEMSEDFSSKANPSPKQEAPTAVNCTKQQVAKLDELCRESFSDDVSQLRPIVEHFRKGAKLSKAEAEDLIQNWEKRLDEYQEAVAMANDEFPV